MQSCKFLIQELIIAGGDDPKLDGPPNRNPIIRAGVHESFGTPTLQPQNRYGQRTIIFCRGGVTQYLVLVVMFFLRRGFLWPRPRQRHYSRK